MNNQLIIKHPVLEVYSWEADADNGYSITERFSSEEEAVAAKHMCEHLFSKGNGYKNLGIGNLSEDDSAEIRTAIITYLVSNPTLLEINKVTTAETLKDIIEVKHPTLKDDEWIGFLIDYYKFYEDTLFAWYDVVMEYNHKLLGESEWFFSRVCDKCVLYFENVITSYALKFKINNQIVKVINLNDKKENVCFELDVKEVDSFSLFPIRDNVLNQTWTFNGKANKAVGKYGNLEVSIQDIEIK